MFTIILPNLIFLAEFDLFLQRISLELKANQKSNFSINNDRKRPLITHYRDLWC